MTKAKLQSEEDQLVDNTSSRTKPDVFHRKDVTLAAKYRRVGKKRK